MAGVPLSPDDLSHGLCDKCAERSVAVLELGDLTVEVPRAQALAQQFHAMHLRLDAASAVVSTPSSPERADEVFRGASASFRAIAPAVTAF